MTPAGFAQSISVFDIDASGIPAKRAKLYAFDASGNQVAGLSPGDVVLREDGAARVVTRISCPAVQPPQAISSVLTIDVSGSMSGSGVTYAKAAARAWVDALPLGRSEGAITTFDHGSYLNKDFTTDRSELRAVIDALGAYGGTDYNAALLRPPAGALLVTRQAQHRKVIVFRSDGYPNGPPDEAAIIAEADRQGAVIYSVILGMTAPQSVKNISERTGGQCFERITTADEAADAYRRILHAAQGGSPCELEWTSGGCAITRALELAVPSAGVQTTTAYSVPMQKLPQLVYAPSRSLRFGEVAPGGKPAMQLTLTAQGRSVSVTRITGNNPLFTVTSYGGGAPPFTLGSGQSRTLTVEYAPVDSSYAYCLFTVESDACLGGSFYSDGGWRGKTGPAVAIKVSRPNGGETLVAGSTEELVWEGVMPEEKVKLEYSVDGGSSWTTIASEATGLRYEWRVPRTPSDRCLLRATAQARPAYIGDMALIPAGTFRMGDITGAGNSNEKPVHEVDITRPFLLGRTEVTQAQWTAVMGTYPSRFKGEDDPVEQVSWYDAVEFCNRLSKLEGLDTCYSGGGSSITCDFTADGYRLPTEAEWEYACRGGTETDFYTRNMTNSSCTPLDPALDRAGWYCGNANDSTRSVGLKEPNAYGLYDMHGNIWEWCWDLFSSNYYGSSPAADPRGPASGPYLRVLRGGSWRDYALYARSAIRYYNGHANPVNRFNTVGFRLARTY